jgi:hypothetical protein
MTTITPNKQLTEPNINDLGWGLTLNTDFSLLDQALGASYAISIVPGTTANPLVLSNPTSTGLTPTTVVYWWVAQQWSITSTTTLTADQIIQIPSGTGIGGAWVINNNVTSGNANGHTVSVRYGSSGQVITIGTGKSAFIYLDGTGIFTAGTNSSLSQTYTAVSTTATLPSSVFGGWVYISGSTYTITTPTPVGNAGSSFQINLQSGSTAITFSTPSGVFSTPSGSAASTMVLANYGNNYVYTFVSNGTNWNVFSSPVASNSSGRVAPRVYSAATQSSPWAWNSDPYDQLELTALANALTISADAGTPVDGQKAIFRIKDNLSQISFTGTSTTTTLTTTTTVTLTAGTAIVLASNGTTVGTIATTNTGTSFTLTGGVAYTSVAMYGNPTYSLVWTTGSSKSFEAVGVVLPTATTAGKIIYVGCIYNGAAVRWDAVAVNTQA